MSAGTDEDKIPRGIRNNNPGNIRYSVHYTWTGQTGEDGHGFCEFSLPVYGIRAMAILLKNYVVHDGCITVRDIITRWAPPSENRTEDYIEAVCKATGMTDTETVSLSSDLVSIISAIIGHENGMSPYTSTTIHMGVAISAHQ